jgi:hypothetical protein
MEDDVDGGGGPVSVLLFGFSRGLVTGDPAGADVAEGYSTGRGDMPAGPGLRIQQGRGDTPDGFALSGVEC